MTAFHYAVEKNDDKIIKLFLIKAGLGFDLGASRKCIQTIELFYNTEYEFYYPFEYSNSLICAIKEKEEILSEFLIRKNADIYLTNRNENTLLDYVQEKGLIRIEKLLKQRRKYSSYKNLNLNFELADNIMHCFKELTSHHRLHYNFKKFFEADYRDHFGKTLLHYAVHVQRKDIVKELLKSDVFLDSINGKDYQNKTPLIYAMEEKNYEIMKHLLYNGASFENQSYEFEEQSDNISQVLNKLKSLFDCIYNEEYDKFIRQLENIDGLNVLILFSGSDYKGKTIFDYIVKTNNYDLVKHCLMKGAIIKERITSENQNIQRLFSFVTKCFHGLTVHKYERMSFIRHIEKSGNKEIISKVHWKEAYFASKPVTLLDLAHRKADTKTEKWLTENGAIERNSDV
uniref:Ankyrin repeat protein n=1 Tax=Panagrolaimus sp. ES5 TaxID=591445 RepID=A0AC34GP40_9BILA